jgi:hypothetical protein
MTKNDATTVLGELLQRKYDETRAKGATHEEALAAVRSVWLQACGVPA